MKQVFKVIFRYDEETEDFLKWASKYCKFMRGPDQRGRGYGIDASEQKALRKELEAKFGTIEMARQTLPKYVLSTSTLISEEKTSVSKLTLDTMQMVLKEPSNGHDKRLPTGILVQYIMSVWLRQFKPLNVWRREENTESKRLISLPMSLQ